MKWPIGRKSLLVSLDARRSCGCFGCFVCDWRVEAQDDIPRLQHEERLAICPFFDGEPGGLFGHGHLSRCSARDRLEQLRPQRGLREMRAGYGGRGLARPNQAKHLADPGGD
jgi:hypothetical protein